MRHNILLVLIFLLITVNVSGQITTEKRPRWYFGAQAGTSVGDVGGIISQYNFTNYPGILAGFFAQYQLSTDFSLRVNLEFDQRHFGMDRYNQGLRYADTSYTICWDCYYDYKVDFESYYLTVPIVFVYGKNNERFGIQFRAGMYFSLLLKSWYDGYEELFISPESGNQFLAYDIEPGFFRLVYTGESNKVMNTSDAGVIFGLGGSYALTNRLALMLEAGLQVGFQPIFENPSAISFSQRAYQFKGGIIYRIPRNGL